MTFTTDQEAFWQGGFGNDYTERNVGSHWVASNTAFFGKLLNRTSGIESVIEFGSNIGLNLIALRHLLPDGIKSLRDRD